MGALRLNFGVLDGVVGGAGGGVMGAAGVVGVDGDRMLLLLLDWGVDGGGRCDGATLGLLTMVSLLLLVLVLPLDMNGFNSDGSNQCKRSEKSMPTLSRQYEGATRTNYTEKRESLSSLLSLWLSRSIHPELSSSSSPSSLLVRSFF
jgi:hypothetical protein